MDELERRLQDIEAKLQLLEGMNAKLDRMWAQIDVIRTHSAAYLGDNMALTYLADETPMLINSNDFYGPLCLIGGGRYEEEYVQVLYSFLQDGAIFLDVGANLGFFALRIADRLRHHGHVYAFEPHPTLVKLARQTMILNGLEEMVTVFEFGLSDVEADVEFRFPKGHLGGGAIGRGDDTLKFDNIPGQVKRLDDVFPSDLKVDLMKIDVESHELAVLRGMRDVMRRSPSLKIIFEKTGVDMGFEDEMEALFHEHGFALYSVVGQPILAPLATGELAKFSGYVFASRPEQIDHLDRRRFSICPSQLWVAGQPRLALGDKLITEGEPGKILFHGPYWSLLRGVWELRIHGSISGDIEISVAERYRYVTQRGTLSSGQSVWRFVNDRDLVRFEILFRAAGSGARVEIDRLEFVRAG